MSRRVLIILVWLVPLTSHATPPDLFGFGSRSAGLAMTGTAYADDAEAVFANPAGLARARRCEVSLGFHAAGYQADLNDRRFAIEPARGLVTALHFPIPFGGVLKDTLVLGLGFYTPSKVLIRGRVQLTERPQFPVLDRAQVVAAQMGLGVDLSRLVPNLRLGVGVSALADLTGKVEVRLDETQTFVSRTETELLTSPSPIVGASFDAGPMAFGVVYRGEVLSKMQLDVLARDLPVQVPELSIGGTVQYAPHTLVFETAVTPAPGWRIIANATTRFWSGWPGTQQATSMSSRLAPKPGFSNVVSPRVALEREWRSARGALALRGGYAYEPTPAPPARNGQKRMSDGSPLEGEAEATTEAMRLLDSTRHVLTSGVGLELPLGDASLILDLYTQLHILQRRTHLIALEGETDPMRTSGFVLAGGWSLGVAW